MLKHVPQSQTVLHVVIGTSKPCGRGGVVEVGGHTGELAHRNRVSPTKTRTRKANAATSSGELWIMCRHYATNKESAIDYGDVEKQRGSTREYA
jgi:hypothetical protein